MLSDLTDDELVLAVEMRGYRVNQPFKLTNDRALEQIYQLRRNNKNFDKELSDYIWDKLGRVL